MDVVKKRSRRRRREKWEGYRKSYIGKTHITPSTDREREGHYNCCVYVINAEKRGPKSLQVTPDATAILFTSGNIQEKCKGLEL